MNSDAYMLAALALAEGRPVGLAELHEAAEASGRLGRGWRFEARFGRAATELAFAGLLRPVARDRMTICNAPYQRREDQ